MSRAKRRLVEATSRTNSSLLRVRRPLLEPLEERCVPSGGYIQTNLVSDVPGLAQTTDQHLANPWGISFSATGAFWIANNNSGVSTLYDGEGRLVPASDPLVVNIPLATSTGTASLGAATGTVFNGGTGFDITLNGQSGPSLFLFATEEGTILGWNPELNRTQCIVAVDRSVRTLGSAAANYAGLALATSAQGTLLYAADFRGAAIDIFDSNFQPVQFAQGFHDSALPADFAPFNIENL